MASVAWHFFHQFRENRRVRLFAGTDGYADGEQQRDFVWVDDVVEVNLFFLEHPDQHGIFNVGTGRADTFNAVAQAVIAACDVDQDRAALEIAQLVGDGRIEYIELPENLAEKYQSFTEADLSRLRASGYDKPFASVAHGVADYVRRLRERLAPGAG